jgi:uncharacterized membrane protein
MNVVRGLAVCVSINKEKSFQLAFRFGAITSYTVSLTRPSGTEQTMRTLLIYIACLIVFLGLDSIWLGYISTNLYAEVLNGVMAEHVRVTAAVSFYLLQIVGILAFVLPHARRGGNPPVSPWIAFFFGLLFGLCTYGTYDLTNEAVLKAWTWNVTFADMAWGAFVTGVASAAGSWMERLLGPP